MTKSDVPPVDHTTHELAKGTTSEPSTMGTKLATVALVGVGVALIEVELIPGMLIGVAAMMAPKLLPRLGIALRPLLKSAVRAGYALAERTKETLAEAGEQFQDIGAEVRAEQAHPVAHAPAAGKTKRS